MHLFFPQTFMIGKNESETVIKNIESKIGAEMR